MGVQDTNQSKAAPTSMEAAFAQARTVGGQAPQAQPDAPQRPTAQAAQQTERRPGLFRFGEVGGAFMRAPMGRNPASEVLTKLTKALEEQYAVLDKSYEYTLIGLDVNSTTQVGVSVLIVAVRERANPTAGVAFHTLLLEGSIEPLTPRFVQEAGQNIEILRMVSDYNNAQLAKVAADAVVREMPGNKIYNADACVVPRNFDVNDKEKVYSLASNAAFACATELETQRPDFVDMNLANASKDENLTVRPAFVPQQIANALGAPIRSDITIDLTVTNNTQQGQMRDAIERQSLVSRINGFLDLVWAPEQPSANPYAPYQQGPVNYQRYVTRFVMTQMMMQQASTLPMQLLALVTAMSLNEGNAWIQGFRPQPFSTGEVDLNDIGAIGIEIPGLDPATAGQPYGKRIPTQGDSFTPANLAQLATATIKPGLIISLDVEECGPSSWYNGFFAAAGAGHQEANDTILNAGNFLTNGALSRHVAPGTRVCTDENNRIHLGTYVDNHGVLRDLRDLGYLQVLNMVGEKDPVVVRDWSDTFNRTDYSLDQRLAARKRIIQGLLPSAQFTGFARRVSFNKDFTDGLVKACAECGLNLRAVAPYTDLNSFERASASFQNTLSTGGHGNLFHAGGYSAYGSNAAVGGRGFGGRFF